MDFGSNSMNRPSASLLASVVTLASLGVTAFIPKVFPGGLFDGSYHGRRGHSTFVNRGLPGHFHNPPRPRKRCQRRGRR